MSSSSQHNNSKSLCVLPWLQLSTKQNGRVRSCGYAKTDGYDLPMLRFSHLDESWNSLYFRQLRQQMLQGESPANCRACYEREACGGLSRRQQENRLWQSRPEFQQAVAATDPSSGRLKTQPIRLDIRTGNICNLKCVNCHPSNSQKWLEDRALLNRYPNTQPTTARSAWNEEDQAVIKYLESSLKEVREISFLGGEPLASQAHERVIGLISQQRPELLKLKYVTNGTLIRPHHVQAWNQTQAVQLMLSLDGLERHQEFLRFPLSWTRFLESLELLKLRAGPQIEICFLITVNNLNVNDLPRIIQWARANYPTFSIRFGAAVERPEQMSLQNLPIETKRKYFEALNRFAASDPLGASIRGFANFMMADDLWPEWGGTLINYLNDLDLVRGTQWRQLFNAEDLRSYPLSEIQA